MNFIVMLSYISALATAGIAVMAIHRDHHSFVHRIFTAGMILFALESALTGFAYHSSHLDAFLYWQWLKLMTASLLPVFWLSFSLSFGHDDYLESIYSWKWILLLAFLLPMSLVTFFYNDFFMDEPVILTATSMLSIHVGSAGYIWHLSWIIFAVLILMNLERTFRHATGHIRWQTKFMFLAISSIFGVHLFTDSQVILFKSINPGRIAILLGTLLVADILMLRSLFRGKPLSVSIHLSHQFLHNSLSILIIGIYFIIVGSLAWLSLRFGWISNIHLAIFFIFIAMIGIAAFLLSDRLRMKRKRFISRHFNRPQYDYRKIWEDFTERTASITQSRDLCNVIVRMISETLEILSVNIWLIDDRQEKLFFGGSTVFTDKQFANIVFSAAQYRDLIQAMADQSMLLDLKDCDAVWGEDLKNTYQLETTKESLVRYCVPLIAAGQFIGIMTLSEKVFYETLSLEESELVKTIADQAAASLLNMRLSKHLRQAKESEAFQSMSAFFMHDLKNLASKLSLVTQTLPLHLDNPLYRSDALRIISQSVQKINTLTNRLSFMSQKLNLALKEIDLNDIVTSTVSELKEYIKTPIFQHLTALPPLSLDGEQTHKVIENLLINANDAIGQEGEIHVATILLENWVEISVSDNGAGMSKEFMENKLFRPFQTTKKQGMGIGLYHCKSIVEAHHGRIEIESEEGKGTIVRVLMPLNRKFILEEKNGRSWAYG